MKISYNWLKELLPDLKQTPKEVADVLTRHIFEIEGMEEIAIDPKITVARVEKIEPHPNADRLKLATITDGKESKKVVCGATNYQVGDIVAYAPPKTMVKDEEGNPFEIKEATIRGEKSPGMLASLREMGLGSEHSGIYILPHDTEIGSKLADHIPNDTILDVDITPNRAHDCMSHLGIAREISALLDIEVKEPETEKLPEKKESIDGYTLNIEDEHNTPRYMGIGMSGGKNTDHSPLWMQARLLAAGARPINMLVDIGNYVMFEVGNPSHAFDSKKLRGNTIGVRIAKKKEQLELLDGSTIEIPEKSQVITSDDKPVALAGIMGGKETEVDTTTTDILLEVANFRAYGIQETARMLGVRTEASSRFSKGIDPSITEASTRRLVYLLQKLTGAHITGMLDYYPNPQKPHSITFNPERPSAVAGMDISKEQARDMLKRLRCTIAEKENEWTVTVPEDRIDLSGEHDLVEEVIRVIGLENIPSNAPVIPKQSRPLPKNIYWREVIRDTLVELGMTETYNYSFEPENTANILGIDKEKHLTIRNPIAPEQKHLRVSLLPGLLAHFMSNRESFHKKFSKQEKALFEVGSVYRAGDGGRVQGIIEKQKVAGMIIGRESDMRMIVSHLLTRLGIDNSNYQNEGIVAGGKRIGSITELTSDILKQVKYREPISIFELDMEMIMELVPEEANTQPTLEELKQAPIETTQYMVVSRYPSVMRDVSVLIDAVTSTEAVQELIERTGGELVIDSDLFDEYEPPEGGRKGLAFHIEYQAQDRTLTDEEINKVHAEILTALKAEMDAQIR